MSTRSIRSAKKSKQLESPSFFSPTGLQDGFTQSPKVTKPKSGRKIRRTQDLICLDMLVDDKDIIMTKNVLGSSRKEMNKENQVTESLVAPALAVSSVQTRKSMKQERKYLGAIDLTVFKDTLAAGTPRDSKKSDKTRKQRKRSRETQKLNCLDTSADSNRSDNEKKDNEYQKEQTSESEVSQHLTSPLLTLSGIKSRNSIKNCGRPTNPIDLSVPGSPTIRGVQVESMMTSPTCLEYVTLPVDGAKNQRKEKRTKKLSGLDTLAQENRSNDEEKNLNASRNQQKLESSKGPQKLTSPLLTLSAIKTRSSFKKRGHTDAIDLTVFKSPIIRAVQVEPKKSTIFSSTCLEDVSPVTDKKNQTQNRAQKPIDFDTSTQERRERRITNEVSDTLSPTPLVSSLAKTVKNDKSNIKPDLITGESLVPENRAMNAGNVEKRKIVKAKRHLRKKRSQTQDENEMLQKEKDVCLHGFSNFESIITREENIDQEEVILIDSDLDNQCNTDGNEESKHTDLDVDIGLVSNKAIIDEDIPDEKSLNSFLVVEALPSPISPSERNANYSLDTNYLTFKSSQENLYPSTSGTVESSKRRTYELEDSIIDISSLKSLSEKDLKKMSCISSSTDIECKTPGLTYSKVTTRRRWNKSNNFSPLTNKSPSWVKNRKSSESINLSDSTESNKHKSTTKTFFSKIKMPNFAAIHQKALEKVENLSEYKDRKALRAKLLLAGLKPPSAKESRKQLAFSEKSKTNDSKKELRFAPGTVERKTSPTFIPLPSTPRPKFELPVSPSPRPFQFGVFKSGMNDLPKKNQKGCIPVLKFHQKGSPLKERKCGVPQKPFQSAFTFKAKDNELHNIQIKAVATKSKPAKNALESRRCAIKGVRSNRRFELLMNMRKGK